MTYLLHRAGVTLACAFVGAQIGALFFAITHVLHCVRMWQFLIPDDQLMLSSVIVFTVAGALASRMVHWD